MSDIFISYASEDKARIRPLVDALQQRGWTVWWDRTILAGKVWEREIEVALAGSRCVIVVWSKASSRSDWVWTEADEGRRRGILLPVLLDSVTIPLAFRKIQAANLIGWRGETLNSEFEDLARAVRALLGSNDPRPASGTEVVPSAGGSKVKWRWLAISALGLVCFIALKWYFASARQNAKPPVTPVTSALQTPAAGVSRPQTSKLGTRRRDAKPPATSDSSPPQTPPAEASRPQNLQFGLYRRPEESAEGDPKYWEFLRFYPDGRIVGVTMGTTATATEVDKWLNVGGNGSGHYAVDGDSIRFSLYAPIGIVDYQGKIIGSAIDLSWFSHINNHRGHGRFELYEPAAK